jgi:osmoprotectant transport system permease protein
MEYLEFFIARKTEIAWQMLEHLKLSAIAVGLATFVGVITGIVLTRIQRLSVVILNIVNVIQTIPSLALLGFLIPVVGIGDRPAILALFLYSLLAIIKNTISGINQVDNSLIEAAVGMGLTDFQILRLVQLPLAAPIIFAGIRIATVTCVGIATLCAAVGAGGLGQFIFRGISMVNNKLILAGALPAAVLALVLDGLLLLLEKKLTPKRYTISS